MKHFNQCVRRFLQSKIDYKKKDFKLNSSVENSQPTHLKHHHDLCKDFLLRSLLLYWGKLQWRVPPNI